MAVDLLHEITTRIYDTKSVPSLKISALVLGELEFFRRRKSCLVFCDGGDDEKSRRKVRRPYRRGGLDPL